METSYKSPGAERGLLLATCRIGYIMSEEGFMFLFLVSVHKVPFLYW